MAFFGLCEYFWIRLLYSVQNILLVYFYCAILDLILITTNSLLSPGHGLGAVVVAIITKTNDVSFFLAKTGLSK